MDRTNYQKIVFLTVLVFVDLLTGYCMVNAENWKRFTGKQLDGGYFAYDQESVCRVSSTTLLVWEKKIFPAEEKLKARKKKENPIKMRLWEINCKKRTGKLLSIKVFDQDENLLSSLNTAEPNNPELIPPHSMGEALYNILCSKRKR